MADAKWVWNKYCLSKDAELLLLRKVFFLDLILDSYFIRISADSRYKLYINNKYVCNGPCRSSTQYKYYEEVDISAYLIIGINVISAEVAHYSGDIHDSNCFDSGPVSVLSTMRGGFLIIDLNNIGLLNTDCGWKCYSCKGYQFLKSGLTPYAGYYDYFDGEQIPFGWKDSMFSDLSWDNAVELMNARDCSYGGLLSPWPLKKRLIPLPYLKKHSFKKVMRHNFNSDLTVKELLEEKSVMINADAHVWFELDAGEYMNAEIVYKISGGSGAKIEIVYGECYGLYNADGYFSKNIRDDCSGNQKLNGDTNTILCCKGEQEYSPFAYKTFRFIRIDIFTQATPLVLKSIETYKTGYPFEIKGKFSTSDYRYNQLWDISMRTLDCCTYETYMDCPYYEQMQYLMDTMLQASYSYYITDDYRLIEKAIDDFAGSQLENGIIPCNAPAKFIQIIPGFIFYFIYLLHDYYRFTGNINFVKKYLSVAEKAINFFKESLNQDYLLNDTSYWQFVDWTADWKMGSPVTSPDETNIIYCMMMVKALDNLADLNEACSRNCIKDEYIRLSENIAKSINNHAWNSESGLYCNTGDRNKKKSQHVQIWAVLADIASKDRSAEIMRLVITDASLTECSYPMNYFLFRALEKVGLYYETRPLIRQWELLIDKNLTTWTEDNILQRSDCHAWSSVFLHEFPACYLGIQPLEPGYAKVLIRPQALWITDCFCEIPTVRGTIIARYIKSGNTVTVTVEFPVAIEAIFVLPSGEKLLFNKKIIEVSFPESIIGPGKLKEKIEK